MTCSYRESLIALGSRIGWSGSLLGAGLALSLGASNGPPAPPAPQAPPPPIAQPAPVAQPPTRTLAVFRAASPAPGTPYVGIIGDSTGSQLVMPLAAELNRRGIGVVSGTDGGCQPTDVVLAYGSQEYFDRHWYCTQDAPRRQNDMTAQFHPKTVVWADAMEWSDIKTGNRLVAAGSDAWRRLILAGWDRTLKRLGNAAVVLVLPTWWAGSPTNSPASFPVDKQRALFRTWAAGHPGRVTVVDLAPVVCPSGPPCEQVMNGVHLRSDFLHYTPEALRRAMPVIMAAPALRSPR